LIDFNVQRAVFQLYSGRFCTLSVTYYHQKCKSKKVNYIITYVIKQNKRHINTYHQGEWYVYHSDLSWHVSNCSICCVLPENSPPGCFSIIGTLHIHKYIFIFSFCGAILPKVTGYLKKQVWTHKKVSPGR